MGRDLSPMHEAPGTARDAPSDDIERGLLEAVAALRGHFRYESGHHGDLWLDLDRLLVDVGRTRRYAAALAERAAACRLACVCGPLTGGAFLAQLLAGDLGADFVFAERLVSPAGSISYRIPDQLRATVRGRRVLLVDDAVNAGSALLATRHDLLACGAELVGCASLLALGEAAERIPATTGVPFHWLLALERGLWPPDACPLCASGAPLVDRVPESGPKPTIAESPRRRRGAR
jgi:orotate phosphoribosyltransferase